MADNNQLEFSYISDILTEFKQFPHHPFKIQRAVFKHLEAVMEGRSIQVNATNPFIFDLETAAVLTAGFCSYDNDLNRKQYPAAALTPEDLYHHMCDKDYIGRFALPSRATFTFLFNVEEIISRMKYDPKIDAMKVTIPRNTFIEVGGMTFTMEYPVEIRQLTHGGIQVLIDTEIESPIQTLKTNIVKFETADIKESPQHYRGTKWLKFELEVLQVKITTVDYTTTRAAPFVANIPLTDYFYYARVFYQLANNEWVEMKTTHSPDVYDVANPTAVLKVLDDKLKVYIPQIYVDSGYTDGKIRVDMYETKGEIAVDLSGYSFSDYGLTFRAIDGHRDKTIYMTSLANLSSMSVFSTDVATGGRNQLSFKQLRDRVIENSIGIRHIPISNIQIETQLEDEGFTLVKNVDVVTNRSYLASRSLPKPTNQRLLTPSAASIETLNSTVGSLIGTGYVYNNGTSLTISPEAVYESKNGILTLLNKSEVDSILALNPDELVKDVNSRSLYRSPFHYVLDMTSKVYDLRAYYLDAPLALDKSFIDANDTTALLQVTVSDFSIKRITKIDPLTMVKKEGYKLTIMTSSDENYERLSDDKCYVQLAFIPPNEREYAYVNGTYLGKEGKNKIFEFEILTNFNVNSQGYLELTNFKQYNLDDRIVNCRLDQTFDILFCTDEVLTRGWRLSPLDNKLGKYLLPPDTKAIVNEKIRLKLGYDLTDLWKKVRTIVSEKNYRRYEENVIKTYKDHVLDKDPLTGTNITITGNTVGYKILHHKGDPVLDENGDPIIEFYKGDVIKDYRGNPELIDPRKVVVQLDLMLIEWVYFIADHAIIDEYRNQMFRLYVDWIVDALGDLNEKVLEQTRIYFYPKATLGAVDVMINDGIVKRVPAAQELIVDLVVKQQVYNNLDLRNEIKKTTVKILNEQLNTGVISTSTILSALKENYGFDVLGIDISGLGNDNKIITMTILDDSKRCSLKKRLVIESNNTLFVEEAVDVNFINHSIR